MATTANGLPHPVGTDKVVDGDDAIHALATFLDPPYGGWTNYVPVLGNITLGNGTLLARFHKLGRTVTTAGFVSFGSTTLNNASPMQVTLPTTATGLPALGVAAAADTSAGLTIPCIAVPYTSTVVAFRSPAGAFVSSAAPFAWAVGDVLSWSLTYESTT